MRIPSRTSALVLDLLRALEEEAQARRQQDAAEETEDGATTLEPQPEGPSVTTGEEGRSRGQPMVVWAADTVAGSQNNGNDDGVDDGDDADDDPAAAVKAQASMRRRAGELRGKARLAAKTEERQRLQWVHERAEQMKAQEKAKSANERLLRKLCG